MSDLEAIVRGWMADAEALRRHGQADLADILDRCAADVRGSNAVEWMTWLSEQQALDRSAKSADYFRARRVQWETDGYAMRAGRRWFYRRCVVPRSRLSSIQRAEAAMEKAG